MVAVKPASRLDVTAVADFQAGGREKESLGLGLAWTFEISKPTLSIISPTTKW